jgi:hypothetical protein
LAAAFACNAHSERGGKICQRYSRLPYAVLLCLSFLEIVEATGEVNLSEKVAQSNVTAPL